LKWLHIVAFTLTVVGALNWGLVGLLDLNLVNAIFGSIAGLETIVYILVGVSAVYLVVTHKNDCKICGAMMGGAK